MIRLAAGPPDVAPGERGLSLIETIVALLLFAAMAAALHQGLAIGTRGIRHADDQSAATALAVARLASAGTEIALVDGQVLTGSEARFRWRMTIEPAGRETDASAPRTPRGHWVTVDVTWSGGGSAAAAPSLVQLRALKLGGPP